MTDTANNNNNNTNNNNNDNNINENSCSALDLSWLSESVMEAALDTKHLKLTDVAQFHESLRAAEEFGAMEHAVSERLHHKIDAKTSKLVAKMVAHETVRVSKRLGLYVALKAHKTWDQVQFMADMHGQGAYIVMRDFDGLHPDDLLPGLEAFHAYIADHKSESRRTSVTLKLPFSQPSDGTDLDEQARGVIERQVAEKISKQYRKFYASLMDEDLGGYPASFLEQLQYSPEEFADMVGVTLKKEDEKLS